MKTWQALEKHLKTIEGLGSAAWHSQESTINYKH